MGAVIYFEQTPCTFCRLLLFVDVTGTMFFWEEGDLDYKMLKFGLNTEFSRYVLAIDDPAKTR